MMGVFEEHFSKFPTPSPDLGNAARLQFRSKMKGTKKVGEIIFNQTTHTHTHAKRVRKMLEGMKLTRDAEGIKVI